MSTNSTLLQDTAGKAAQSSGTPTAPQQAAAPAQPSQSAAPKPSASDKAIAAAPVKIAKGYSDLNEKITELFDGLGVHRSATIPHIEGQEPAEHIAAVGKILSTVGGMTANLLSASHTAYGKNGGATCAFPVQKLQETIIPAKSELAKDAIDACKSFVNGCARLIGDKDPLVQVAKNQLQIISRFDGQGMTAFDLGVGLINIPTLLIQRVAKLHSGTKDGGHHPLRRSAKL